MIELLQVRSELAPLLAIYSEREPRRVLEIGCWQGGTLREWLAGAPERVVAVDLDHQRSDLYPSWVEGGTELCVIEGDSQADAVREQIREHGPFDWLFIDGDHAEDAARRDVELALECAAPGAVLVLHDIVDCPGDGPATIFAELGESHRSERFVEGQERWGHGIGVVYLP